VRLETGQAAEIAVELFIRDHGIAVQRHVGDVACDLVAWGCVRIEVKSSSPRPVRGSKSQYFFGFSPDQLMREPPDVIVLVTLPEMIMYFFDGRHPVFTWKRKQGGGRKVAVTWMVPDARAYGRGSEETYMTGELMASMREKVDIIEQKRLSYSLAMLAAGYRRLQNANANEEN
jgi:hypothetical protein